MGGKVFSFGILFLVLIVMFFTSIAESAKTIIVGDDHRNPPFSFLDENGQPDGFNVELIRAVGELMGWDVQVELGSWFEAKERLRRGEVHVISGMLYTDERAQDFSFTTRHSVASADIFSRLDRKIASLEELRGQSVAVNRDDIVYEYLLGQDLGLEFVFADSFLDALHLVDSSDVELAAILFIPGHYFLYQEELKDIQSNNLHYAFFDNCFAVQKGQAELLTTLDEALRILKKTGKYDEIYAKWLGIFEQHQQLDWQRRTRALVVSLIVGTVVLGWALILNHAVRIKTADLTRLNTSLTRSREALYYANDELRTTVQQLTATTSQLTEQYEQLQKVEAALEEERNLLRTTLLSVGEGIILTDCFGEVVIINLAAQKLTGWEGSSALGQLFSRLFPDECASVIQEVIESEMPVEIAELVLDNSGMEIIVACTVAPVQDQMGVIEGAVAVLRDISEATRQRKKIEYLSNHDPLTGLLNRRGFEVALKKFERQAKLPLAIIMADVNGLKLINDAFGHSYGDELLYKTARLLKDNVPDAALVARLGGDEFVLVLSESDLDQAEALVSRIDSLAQQQTVQSIQISIAFGAAVKHNLSDGFDDCYNLAEERMYEHKALSSSYHGSVDRIIHAFLEKSTDEKERAYQVAAIVRIMGEVLGLETRQINELYTASLLQERGKSGFAQSTRYKKTSMSPIEWSELSEFTEQDSVCPSIGESSLQARIIAIADAYEKITSKAFQDPQLASAEAAIQLQLQAGSRFDPELVKIFVDEVLPIL